MRSTSDPQRWPYGPPFFVSVRTGKDQDADHLIPLRIKGNLVAHRHSVEDKPDRLQKYSKDMKAISQPNPKHVPCFYGMSGFSAWEIISILVAAFGRCAETNTTWKYLFLYFSYFSSTARTTRLPTCALFGLVAQIGIPSRTPTLHILQPPSGFPKLECKTPSASPLQLPLPPCGVNTLHVAPLVFRLREAQQPQL